MAKREWVELVDDIDGSTRDVQTVMFSYDGLNYEIELSAKNRNVFEKLMAPYVTHGRVSVAAWVKSQRKNAGKPKGKTRAAKDVVVAIDTNAVRAWAAENGFEVSSRGRIASTVLQAYQAASA